MKSLLKQIWTTAMEPAYEWLFRRFFRAIISRLDEVLGRWSEITAIHAHLEELDAHVRSALASRWETEALSRRMAMLEDRLLGNEAASPELGALPPPDPGPDPAPAPASGARATEWEPRP